MWATQCEQGRREKGRAELGARDTVWSSQWVLGKKNQVAVSTLCSPEEQRGESAFLPEWSACAVAEPSDWSRARTQKCGSCDLADVIIRQKTKPLSLTAALMLPELAVGHRRSCGSECGTGEADTFLPEQLLPVMER